ncbi:MAG: GntR family transcriptional regulator, partial [Saccharothrix sp.]|nr:GntR family transcriptional regulator [Saccharothrix sp.]
TPLVRRMERSRFAGPAGRHSVAMHDEIITAFAASDADLAARLVERNWATLADLPADEEN